MRVINYDNEMKKIISAEGTNRPSLLLHACCAPCSSSVIERLKEHFEITVFFYNPNIDGAEEYAKRYEEEKRLCEIFGLKVIDGGYNAQEFYSAVKGYENEIEGGARCTVCYALRLDKTAETALKNGFDYFTTTLTVSPLKNAAKLNAAGYTSATKYGVKFLPSDFKKNNGYSRSVELSREYGLYRQNYCGCTFSKNKTPS